jgi:hypothetical protein
MALSPRPSERRCRVWRSSRFRSQRCGRVLASRHDGLYVRFRKAVRGMCSLCGVLGAEDHWTDASARPETFGGGIQRTRRQERLERIALANRILRHYRLTLGDFQGQSYVLRSATGREVLVPNLVGMWSAAEKLAGRPCDPLDPDLIAALEDRLQ